MRPFYRFYWESSPKKIFCVYLNAIFTITVRIMKKFQLSLVEQIEILTIPQAYLKKAISKLCCWVAEFALLYYTFIVFHAAQFQKKIILFTEIAGNMKVPISSIIWNFEHLLKHVIRMIQHTLPLIGLRSSWKWIIFLVWYII